MKAFAFLAMRLGIGGYFAGAFGGGGAFKPVESHMGPVAN